MAVRELPIGTLVPFADNVRANPDVDDPYLAALAGDIAQHGLLHPVTVRPAADGSYEVVAGWRRVRAHRLLKRDVVPAVVLGDDVAPAEAVRISFSENMHRHALPFSDRCAAIRQFFDECAGNVKQVAELTQLAPSTIRRYVDISSLGDEVIARLDAQGDQRLTLLEAHRMAREMIGDNEPVPSGTTPGELPPGPDPDGPGDDASQAAEAPARRARKRPLKQSPWIYDADGGAVAIPEALYGSVYTMVRRHGPEE